MEAKVFYCTYYDYKITRKLLRKEAISLDGSSFEFGQYNAGRFSVVLTVCGRDGNAMVTYDIYRVLSVSRTKHLVSGIVCSVKELPMAEKRFWKLVKLKTNIEEKNNENRKSQ